MLRFYRYSYSHPDRQNKAPKRKLDTFTGVQSMRGLDTFTGVHSMVCARAAPACEPAWGGERCGELQIRPAPRDAGLRLLGARQNTSTWGGAVQLAEDGRYHMWSSEILNHCSLDTWEDNSQVVDLTL